MRKCVIIATVLLLSECTLLPRLGRCGESLAAPESNLAIEHDFGNKPSPVWSNGVFLAHDDDDTAAAKLLVFNRAGHLARTVTISFPDAISIHLGAPPLGGMAASHNGMLAVTGEARSKDGAYAPFIAIISSDGGIERVIRPDPFIPLQLTFGPDDTLWVLGREMEGPAGQGPPPHDILRHYDLSGHVLGSFFQSDTFVTQHRHPTSFAFLVASQDRISFYSVVAGEWVEVSPSGTLLGRWRVPLADSTMVTGVALLPSGALYLSLQNRNGEGPPVAVYRINRGTTSVLETVDTAKAFGAPSRGYIMGSDGDRLVVSLGSSRTAWIPATSAAAQP